MIGKIVGYVLEDERRHKGEVRPAIIVRQWSETCVQLQVFMDGDGGEWNDGTPNIVWKTSIDKGNSKTDLGTWHFLED